MPRDHSRRTAACDALQAFARSLPGATEHVARGHPVFKVGGKSFAYVTMVGGALYVTVVLPDSNEAALALAFVKPHHMHGDHGWVTACFDRDEAPPLATFRAWIDESYRAVAATKSRASAKPPRKR